MEHEPLTEIILDGWHKTTCYIINGHVDEFVGRKKEDLVLSRLKSDIKVISSGAVQVFGPETKMRFDNSYIDLVCDDGNERIAIEGKFKVLTDGAVTDNRLEAFFDLYKLEQYVSPSHKHRICGWRNSEPLLT